MYISRTEMDEVLVLIIQEALSLLDFASSIRANRKEKKKRGKKKPFTSCRTAYNESSIKHFHNVRKTQVRLLDLILHPLSWSLVQYGSNTVLTKHTEHKKKAFLYPTWLCMRQKKKHLMSLRKVSQSCRGFTCIAYLELLHVRYNANHRSWIFSYSSSYILSPKSYIVLYKS